MAGNYSPHVMCLNDMNAAHWQQFVRVAGFYANERHKPLNCSKFSKRMTGSHTKAKTNDGEARSLVELIPLCCAASLLFIWKTWP